MSTIPQTSACGIADGSLNHPSLKASGDVGVGSTTAGTVSEATVSEGTVSEGTVSAGETPAGAVVAAGATVSTTVTDPSAGSVSVAPSPEPCATGRASVSGSDFSGTSSECTTIRLLAEYRGVHDTRVSVAFVTSVVGITSL